MGRCCTCARRRCVWWRCRAWSTRSSACPLPWSPWCVPRWRGRCSRARPPSPAPAWLTPTRPVCPRPRRPPCARWTASRTAPRSSARSPARSRGSCTRSGSVRTSRQPWSVCRSAWVSPLVLSPSRPTSRSSTSPGRPSTRRCPCGRHTTGPFLWPSPGLVRSTPASRVRRRRPASRPWRAPTAPSICHSQPVPCPAKT